MKTRSALALILTLPIASLVRLAADPVPAADAPATTTTTTTTTAAAAAPDDDKKTELEMRMDRMGKAYRKLKKQVADPAQNASSLELVGKMQSAAKEAEALTPAKAQDLPEDQRAKFVDDYKKGIKAMEDELSKLSDDLTAGNNTDAAAVVAEMGKMERDDHKQFKRPEKN